MTYSAPPPPPDSGYGYGYGYGAPRTSQKAMWSLVTGLIGLICCAPAGIVAIILGNSAKKEIAASGGAETGAGMAQAGFILGIIALVLMVLGIMAFAGGLVTLPTSTSP